MTRRHVRAIAVFAIVLIALTGARRSGGGGCDSDSGSGTTTTSGGFSSGGSTYDDDDLDVDAPGASTTTSSGGSTSTTPSRSNATADVRLTSCDYDETSQEFTSDLTVTNTSTTQSYNYRILVGVEETQGGVSTGKLLSSDSLTLDNLGPGQTQRLKSESFRPLREAVTFKCSVSRASKYPAG